MDMHGCRGEIRYPKKMLTNVSANITRGIEDVALIPRYAGIITDAEERSGILRRCLQMSVQISQEALRMLHLSPDMQGL